MNRSQRIVLVIAFVCISVVGVFPPWIYVHCAPNRRPVERAAGYRPLFNQARPTDAGEMANLFGLNPNEIEAQPRFFAIRIDGMRLASQISLTILLTVIMLAILKAKR